MGELLVKREAIFHGVSISAVKDSGPGETLSVAIKAEQAEWFAPEEDGAEPDGGLRGFDADTVQGELEFCFERERDHAHAVEQLQTWQQQQPPRLTGIASLRYQYVGLIDRDSSVSIGVKMSAEAQDRP